VNVVTHGERGCWGIDERASDQGRASHV